MRADMRIARKLGVSLRRFLGWEATRYTADGTALAVPEYDEWERALWRALDVWEADQCPNCGSSLTESLWDPKTAEADRAKWLATYRQCLACRALEEAQHKQAELDEEERTRHGDDHFIPHRHRLWEVTRDDEKGR